MNYFLSLLLVLTTSLGIAQNSTYTYKELIQKYVKIADENKDVHFFNMGNSDFGKPIYLCVLGVVTDSAEIFKFSRNTTSVLINNAIHAGEPCGVNASIQLVEKYVSLTEDEKYAYPLVAIIPAYNVGGMHNRNSTSRANQIGPEEYGFRGNARNFDLNRDFMKMDSENMKTFARIYHGLDPDIFIDTHTSNGAEYQYTLTLIASMYNRLNALEAAFIYDEMLPTITDSLKQKDSIDLYPYIELNTNRLEGGIHAFNDLARYSMGYTRLFNSISFTTETHMLKAFDERVKATFKFLNEVCLFAHNYDDEIERVRRIARLEDGQKQFHYFNYDLDTVKNKESFIDLKSYRYFDSSSVLTQQPRLFYDTNVDSTYSVPFKFFYKAKDSVKIPKYYVVRKWEKSVINKLLSNGVHVQFLDKDTSVLLRQTKIDKFSTVDQPYEGHYLHRDVSTLEAIENINLYRGDALVFTRQKSKKYIVESLESRCEDSYFNWGMFDSYLQQKEYFSPYVFEEKAIEILNQDQLLKEEFESLKRSDKEFASSRWNQLYFIYVNSKYYENSHKVLPVYKSLN